VTRRWRARLRADWAAGLTLRRIDERLPAFAARCRGAGEVWDLGAGIHDYRRHFADLAYRTLNADPSAGADVVADLERLEGIADDSVPAALCVAVLEHVAHPWRAAAEIARVLAPGAPLYVWAPFVWEEHGFPDDRFRFSEDAMRALWQEAGLVVESLAGRDAFGGTFFVGAHLWQWWFPLGAPVGQAPRLRERLALAGFAACRAAARLDRRLPRGHLYTGVEAVCVKPR
jgi:SAM-dependent methyltransferase